MKRKMGVKYVSIKAYHLPKLGACVPIVGRYVRLIWGGEQFTKKAQRIVTKHEKIQTQRIQTKNRGKSYGLKMFLSQGKRPVAQKPLATISLVAARLYAFPNAPPNIRPLPLQFHFKDIFWYNLK
jgi:hypothetical protein